MRKIGTGLIVFLGICLLIQSCSNYNRARNLDASSKEFYTLVKYIITPQEKKIFLNLPPDERPAFIEEFWAKRDPDPETEVNEYKEDYFGRIEEANQLFRQGSTPGWLQERGRVYITLGAPDHRQQYPTGVTFYGFPTEVWYYGWFPVIFVDENWTGNYRLDPLSAQHINEINRAQINLRPKVALEQIVFDFQVDVKKPSNGEALFVIKIPYRNIWMEEVEERLETTLDVLTVVSDRGGDEIWRSQKPYNVSIPQDEMLEYLGKDYILDFSAKIQAGKYTVLVEIQNLTGGKRVVKRVNFSMK